MLEQIEVSFGFKVYPKTKRTASSMEKLNYLIGLCIHLIQKSLE